MSKEQTATSAASFKERFKYELLGLFWLAAGVFLLLALVSFNGNDPSINNASHSSATHNLAGVVGAYLADLLFQGFGLAALLLPVGAFGLAWHYFACRQIHFRPLRAAAFFCMLLSLDGLIALEFHAASWFGEPIGEAGGLAGRLLANLLSSGLNTAGSVILLVVMLLVSLMLAVRFSLVLVLDQLLVKWGTFLERRQQQSAARKEAARKKRAKIAEGPVIAAAQKVPPVPQAEAKAVEQTCAGGFRFYRVQWKLSASPIKPAGS